jgi:hypothetical protein
VYYTTFILCESAVVTTKNTNNKNNKIIFYLVANSFSIFTYLLKTDAIKANCSAIIDSHHHTHQFDVWYLAAYCIFELLDYLRYTSLNEQYF